MEIDFILINYPFLVIANIFLVFLILRFLVLKLDQKIFLCNRKKIEKRVHNVLSYNIRNFTRYYKYKNRECFIAYDFINLKKLEFIVLANKFCVISIDFSIKELIYYDKITDEAFFINRDILSIKLLKSLFDKLCNQFNFETKLKDILDDIIFSDFEKNAILLTDNQDEKQMIKNISVNKLSVAELIELPGINIGKANKIKKYLQQNSFNTIQDFINFAQISEEDAKEIQEIFNNDIRYIPKNENNSIIMKKELEE